MVVPADWRRADHRAPGETETLRGRLASLWPSEQDAHGDDDGGGGGGGGWSHPHHAASSSCVEGAQEEGDDWSDEKGRAAARDHQRTILRRTNLSNM